MPFRRTFKMGSVVLILALLIASVPAGAQEDEVTVRLKWLHQVQFAGFYMAQEEGFYAEEGLDVTLEPVDIENQVAIDVVLDGEADFAVAAPEEVVLARSEGKPVQVIAAIFRIRPDVWLVAPGEDIQKPQDFIGKKVALAPGGPTIVYAAMMERLGLDRDEVEEAPMEVWTAQECWETFDVCPNYATNDYARLLEQGEEVTAIWPGDYGIAWYGDVLFTTDAMIEEQPELVERFVRATLKGWRAALEDVDQAVEITLSYDEEDRLNAAHQTQAMRISVPLIDTGDPLGTMEEAVWENIVEVLEEQGFLDESVEVDALYTNEFVESTYDTD